MAGLGGARAGAGRPRGAPNKQTVARQAAARASGLLPHEFLLAVLRGEVIDGHKPTFAERIDAASKAAPYYAAKLASVEVSGKADAPIEIEEVSDAKRARALAAFFAKTRAGS